jgi:hypothetical protein
MIIILYFPPFLISYFHLRDSLVILREVNRLKGLSQTTKDLIDDIYKTPSLWESLTNKNEDKLRLIRLVGQSAETDAVPYLIPLLLVRNADMRSTAVNAVESLLRTCKLEDLVWLDEHLRGFSPYLLSSGLELWYKIKISDFKKMDRSSNSIRMPVCMFARRVIWQSEKRGKEKKGLGKAETIGTILM